MLPVIQFNWENFLNRLKQSLPDVVEDADPSESALNTALDKLTQCGLIEQRTENLPESALNTALDKLTQFGLIEQYTEKDGDQSIVRYGIHPGVAEAGRTEAATASSVIPAQAGTPTMR